MFGQKVNQFLFYGEEEGGHDEPQGPPKAEDGQAHHQVLQKGNSIINQNHYLSMQPPTAHALVTITCSHPQLKYQLP